MSADPGARRLAAAGDAALRLVSTTTPGRIVLAKLASLVDLELLPAEDRDRLRRVLGDQTRPVLPPLAPQELRTALQTAWDADPREELDELEQEPVAVTPTSQVHRGVLDGHPVAIKVLRPGLSARFRQDLSLLEALAGPLGAAFPRVDAGVLLREVRERILDEFDLEHEATAQRRFHRALRRHPFLHVPAPISRLSTEGVMVSEWADGVPLLRARGVDQAAARLLVFVLGGIREGVVHADPDPADVLVGPDGSLTILDFGAVSRVDPQRADLTLAAVEAFASTDHAAFASALAGLGMLPEDKATGALELTRHALGPLGQQAPSRLDVGALIAAGERLEERRHEVLDLVLAGRVEPADLWPARAVGQVFAALVRAAPTAPWRRLVLSALRDGWSAELPA